jgi:hypothetical protein
MEKNRPVSFNYYHSNKQRYLSGTGTFLEFGSAIGIEDDKAFQITFAVVEDQEGNVHRIPEDAIKFTDIPKEG